MKSHTEYLVFETKKRKEMVHITDQVEQVVRRSGVKDGLWPDYKHHQTGEDNGDAHLKGLKARCP